jgi:hypothetical protein
MPQSIAIETKILLKGSSIKTGIPAALGDNGCPRKPYHDAGARGHRWRIKLERRKT